MRRWLLLLCVVLAGCAEEKKVEPETPKATGNFPFLVEIDKTPELYVAVDPVEDFLNWWQGSPSHRRRICHLSDEMLAKRYNGDPEAERRLEKMQTPEPLCIPNVTLFISSANKFYLVTRDNKEDWSSRFLTDQRFQRQLIAKRDGVSLYLVTR